MMKMMMVIMHESDNDDECDDANDEDTKQNKSNRKREVIEEKKDQVGIRHRVCNTRAFYTPTPKRVTTALMKMAATTMAQQQT